MDLSQRDMTGLVVIFIPVSLSTGDKDTLMKRTALAVVHRRAGCTVLHRFFDDKVAGVPAALPALLSHSSLLHPSAVNYVSSHLSHRLM